MTIQRGLAVTGDVQSILYWRDILNNDLNSRPPDVATVEGVIDLTIDDINMLLLTAGYELPITYADSPYGYQYVRLMNAKASACAIERRYGAEETAKAVCKEYADMRQALIDRDVILTDVPGAPATEDLAKSGTSELTATGEEREPFFTRDQKF